MSKKVINRSVKKAYIKTKEYTDKIIDENQDNAEGYSYNSAKNVVSETSHTARSMAIDNVKRHIFKKQNKKRLEHKDIPIMESTAQYRAKQRVLKNKIESRVKTSISVADKVKEFAKAGVGTAKNTIAATKMVTPILLSTGVIAMTFTIIICMIGLVIGSSYGILMAAEDTGSEYTLREVITIINKEYFNEIENIKTAIPHDEVIISGEEPNWKNVLAVYSVKLTTDQNGTEVVTINDGKIELIREVFWDMTELSYETKTYEDIEFIEITDDEGNTKQQKIEVSKTRLIVNTINKPVAEAIVEYDFSKEQEEQLNELLEKHNDAVWPKILQG